MIDFSTLRLLPSYRRSGLVTTLPTPWWRPSIFLGFFWKARKVIKNTAKYTRGIWLVCARSLELFDFSIFS